MDKQIVITKTVNAGVGPPHYYIEIPLSVLKNYSEEDIMKLRGTTVIDRSIVNLAARANDVKRYYERLMINVCTVLDIVHYNLTVKYINNGEGKLSMHIEFDTYNNINIQDRLITYRKELLNYMDIVSKHKSTVYIFEYKPSDKH